MSDAMERWLHLDNQPKPSNHECAEWVRARCDDLMVSLQIGREIPIAYDAGVLIDGLRLYLEIGPGREVKHDVVWRLDISMDGGATWEEVATWSEADYPANAERCARARAAAARLDGYSSRVVKLTRHFVEQSEEVSS